ncbi:MAG: hypothetical protein MJ086_04345 [Lachnospiraceae bacterium]|nr:hypothetical protein [Lachnospiraceae bacterium]
MKRLKISLIIFTVILSIALLAGCGSTATTYPAHVEGALFGGASDDSIAVDVTFDSKWITKNDNTKYNPDLAAFAALCSADSYFRLKDYDKGTQNRVLFDEEEESAYDFTTFFKKLGFTEVKHVESFSEKEYASDSNDSVTMTMAYCNVDKKYDMYVVALRGCFSSGEWLSVFDPGCDGDIYTELTGEHPEWTNKNHFKGMDIAANRADEFIKEFMAANDDPKCKDCILFTGHSRGGSLANILGAKYEKEGQARTYTYTFNTADTTCSEDAGEYKTVFNIFDANDFFTDPLPFGTEKFVRYGTDVTEPISNNAELLNALIELKGRDDYICVEPDAKAQYQELFGAAFSDRASLYEEKYFTETFATKEEAEARAEELQNLIGKENGLGAEAFCSVGEIKEVADGKFELTTKYNGAAVLIGFSKLLAYGPSVYEPLVDLFAQDAQVCDIATLLSDNLAGISGGHLIANSYVLGQNVAK